MSGLFSAIATAIAGVGAVGSAARPIRLDVESSGSANIVRVVADSHLSCKATYQLEVAGNAGGNRSLNRGTVTLPTKGQETVATVRVPDSNSSGTLARLTVTPCDGEAYEQIWKSPERLPTG